MLSIRSLRVGAALLALSLGALLPSHAQSTATAPTSAPPASTAASMALPAPATPDDAADETSDETGLETDVETDLETASETSDDADAVGLEPETPTPETPGDPSSNTSDEMSDEMPNELPSDAPGDTSDETPNEAEPAASPETSSETLPETPGETETPPATDEPTSDGPVGDGLVRYLVENNALVARRDGLTLWQLGFAEASGLTVSPLRAESGFYVGHGNSVLRIDAETGRVLRRWLVPAQVETLSSDGATVLITVRHSEGLTETVRLRDDALQDPVRFGIDPAIFGWLQREASVDEPAARLAQDPTNPWLYVAAGLELLSSGDNDGADNAFVQAADEATTFYDLAGIAQVLLVAGRLELSELTFNAALADFAARDYHPTLLRSRTLHDAYNFPLGPLEAALGTADVEQASVLAERLWLTSPRLGGAQEALEHYADLLEDTGRRDLAALWRERARGSASERTVGSLDQLVATLAASGWYAATSILVAILTLHLTLLCKYWIPQGKMLRRQRSPFGRLFAIRYYSVTEKAVLVMMFAAVLALGTLGHWSDENADLPDALSSGTLANEPARTYLGDNALSGVRGDFILGYTAQISGDTESARTNYQQAGNYPPALNNLAALTDDPALFREVLELSPNLEAARYNLGEQVGALPFTADYQPGYALVTPTRDDFLRASGATWENALVETFANPWQNLADARPPGLPPLLWQLIYLVVLVFATLTVVMLFVPQPRIVQQAPRTFLFHVFALLIPGSSLADEAWGLLLIVPWAVIGLDTMSALFGWGIGLELGLATDYLLLAILYGVNLIAFAVEFSLYRQRLLERRRRRKEDTRSFSLS